MKKIRLYILFAVVALFGASVSTHVSAEQQLSALYPLISNIASQDTTGGPVNVQGSRFGDGSGVHSITVWCEPKISGVVTPQFMPVTTVTANSLIFTAAAGYDVGNYDCRFENYDRSSVVVRNALRITSVVQPSTFCSGSTLKARYIAANALCSGVPCTNGGNVTSIPDTSPSGTGVALVNSGTVHFNSTSPTTCNGAPCFAGAPTISIVTGANMNATLNLGSTTSIYYTGAFLYPNSANAVYMGLQTPSSGFVMNLITPNSGTIPLCKSSATYGPGITWPALTPFQIGMWNDGTNSHCSVKNSPDATFADGAPASGNSVFKIGNVNGVGTAPEFAEVYLCGGATINSTLLSQSSSYLTTTYELPGPTIDRAWDLPTSNGGSALFYRARVTQGAVTNLTASVTCPFEGIVESATTATVTGVTSVESSIPATTLTNTEACDLTLVDPDGSTSTAPGVLHVTTALNPYTIIKSNLLIAWYDPDDTTAMTCVTAGCPDQTKLSTIVDKACFDSDIVQATSSAQVKLGVADATHMGGHNEFLCLSANSSWAQGTSHTYGGSVTAHDLWGQSTFNDVSSGNNTAIFGITPNFQGLFGAPSADGKLLATYRNTSAQNAQWGSSLSGTPFALQWNIPGSTSSPTISLNKSNSGSPVTQTGSNLANQNTGSNTMCGISNAVFSNGYLGETLILGGDPGSTIRGQLYTWAQAHGAN